MRCCRPDGVHLRWRRGRPGLAVIDVAAVSSAERAIAYEIVVGILDLNGEGRKKEEGTGFVGRENAAARGHTMST